MIMKLKDLLTIENDIERQAILKKAFMPYSELIDVDGDELNALTILLNLSLSKPECNNWSDNVRSKQYLSNSDHIDIVCNEIKWLHTHNLKFPDCRVKEQRLIASPLACETSFISSASVTPSFGWSHNSAVYKHTVWLLNPFIWQGGTWCLLDLIRHEETLWLKCLKKLGLTAASLKQLKVAISRDLPEQNEFPDEVSRYSKQIRFPWGDDYLSITPVVSHSMQTKLERLARDERSTLKFTNATFPNSPSIGNLCASVGGNMRVLNYPLRVTGNSGNTFVSSKNKTGAFFDDYQLTNAKFCKVLNHICGAEPLTGAKQQRRVRHYQLRIARKQIALWLLPLIELRDHIESESEYGFVEIETAEPTIKQFLYGDESKIIDLLKPLNQRLHLSLQGNYYSSRYAYHAKLMTPLKQQLKWVLEQLSQPEKPRIKTDHSSEQEQFIYLKALRVESANAMSCPYLCGTLSLTAIWGFVHHYQRQLNQALGGNAVFHFQSFAIFYREEAVRSQAKLTEPSVLAAKKTISNAKRPTILSSKYSDLVVDIVIKVKGTDRISDYGKQLKATLPSTLAGGAVFQPMLNADITWLNTYQSQGDLFYRLKSLPASGAWLFPEDPQPTNLTELESFLDEDESLIPISSGFHFLEPPVERQNALTALHAYAENTMGVAKYLNAIDVRFSGRDHFFKQAFWRQENNVATILIQKDKN